MDDNPSFKMKAISNGSPNVTYGGKRQFIKEGAQAFPQAAFTAHCGPGGLEELAGQLLRLVNGKGQHHQQGQDNR